MNILTSAMMLAPVTATSTILLEHVPADVQRSLSAYQSCLYDVIDRQFDAHPHRFSEPAALASCATVRRQELARSVENVRGGPAQRAAGRKRIQEKFWELDESVWTIVGHLRAKNTGRP